jgi:hypothetical protein
VSAGGHAHYLGGSAVGGVPADDPKAVPDGVFEGVLVEAAGGVSGDGDEAGGARVISGDDLEKASDLVDVADDLGADGDVSASQPDVDRLAVADVEGPFAAAGGD